MIVTERQLAILQAIIDDYILTGLPVGSRTISKRTGMGFSSATIRNEMADLEDEGFLQQPHTSAGRLPSDKAYRLYVDTLMRTASLLPSEIQHIRHYYDRKMSEIEQIIEVTAQALSESTNLISLITAPVHEAESIARIQIVKIAERRAIVIFVLNAGTVKDAMIEIPAGVDDRFLEMLSRILTDRARDQSVEQALGSIRELFIADIAAHRDLVDTLIPAVEAHGQRPRRIIFRGTQNLLDLPEYRDIDKARNFLQLLDARDTMIDLLRTNDDMEFTIKIGHELDRPELADMSIVTASYKIGGRNMGTFGVIGPTRMDYARVIGVLNCVGGALNQMLSHYLGTEQ